VTTNEREWLAERFEDNRAHLRGVAYRMLGSVSDADDAVQELWLRLSRSDASGVENLQAWFTTGVARVCLDMLRSRRSRREEPLESRLPEPIVSPADGVDPEHEALLADSVGLALLVVLETLTPAERLAFVLHDMFGVPFDEIAVLVERTPAAARQLASRARRRAGGAPVPDVDRDRQRELVAAFLAAARGADFDALVAVLDPDVVLRIDRGPKARKASRPLCTTRARQRRRGARGGSTRPAARGGRFHGHAPQDRRDRSAHGSRTAARARLDRHDDAVCAVSWLMVRDRIAKAGRARVALALLIATSPTTRLGGTNSARITVASSRMPIPQPGRASRRRCRRSTGCSVANATAEARP
jgi:RNA polymerase sigma factor (sigma-70 family)